MTSSSSEAGLLLSITLMPLADRGEPLACGAAAGCCSSGSAGCSEVTGIGASSASASSSGGVLFSDWRRRKFSLLLRLPIMLSKRAFSAAGRSMTGSW
ncbi:hypothetical protein D3C76_1181740 [compost metagenome]